MSVALIIMSISIIVFLGVIVLYVCKAINAFANGIEEVNHMFTGLGNVYNNSADSVKEAIAESGNTINQVIDSYVPVLENTASVMSEAAEKIANMKGKITITFGDDKKTDNDENIKYGDF